MALAQDLGVQLYLNLATDRTFLFRDGQVSLETAGRQDQIAAAMAQVEQVLRARPELPAALFRACLRRRHFEDLLQRDLPCAESQLKLMVHSPGRSAAAGVTTPRPTCAIRPIAEILGSEGYREEHARFFRKECVGCGSNYALNLAWRPATLRRGRAVAAGSAPAEPAARREPARAAVQRPALRLASRRRMRSTSGSRTVGPTTTWPGSSARRRCRRRPAVVVDVGCGVGRWAERLLSSGYTVIGIEPAPGMAERGRPASGWARDRLHPGRAAGRGRRPSARARWTRCWRWVPAVHRGPCRTLRRVARWLRPGGVLACWSTRCRRWSSSCSPRAGTPRPASVSTRGGELVRRRIEADLHLFDAGRRCARHAPTRASRSSGRGAARGGQRLRA